MNQKITLRPFCKDDTDAIAAIIKEAWHYEDLASPKIAEKLAKVFLYSCLTNQTYTQVALVDAIPVGIIMGKDIVHHRCPLSLRLRQWSAILALMLSKEGRSVSAIFKSVHGIDQELLAACHKQYQGEVAFFANCADYRGLGIGKRLFHSLIEYMKTQHIQDFYLFTDTSCNYGFYEHQGMVRRQTRDMQFKIQGQNADMQFFIYDYHLD